MQEQLVTYKTAQLAKEIGFDIPVSNVFECHLLHGRECYQFEREFESKENYNNFDYKFEENSIVYSRPTQSLLQKFLREKRDIKVTVSGYGKKFVKNFHNIVDAEYVVNIQVDNDEDEHKFNYWNNSYEDALEVGLYEAMKLIQSKSITVK